MNAIQFIGLIGLVGGALVLVAQAKARVDAKTTKEQPTCDRPHRCPECGR